MASAHIPILLRTGDIGVATEWRSLVLDWAALLTELGTDIYTYLRDDYDQQRVLWPYLVPQGPTKRKVQTKLGRKSAVSLHGPEYLLAVVGLVAITYRRGAADPEHPNRTHVAYYSVGKLDYPQLDWPMLSHVLDALMNTLDPAAAQQRSAQQALRALSRSGMFQPSDPADVFYDFGAWPALLPQLIADTRWEMLFTYLHGPAALASYRASARSWCAAVARNMQRRSDRNQEILDTIQRMQNDSQTGPVAPPAPATPRTTTSSTAGTISGNSTKAGDLRAPAFVPAESLVSPQGGDLRSSGLGTNSQRSYSDAINRAAAGVPGESLDRESCTEINGGGCEDRDSHHSPQQGLEDSSTRDIEIAALTRGTSTIDPPQDAGDISRYLRDDELGSSCLDAAFWCAVNQIMHGTATRYPHTAGERKALQRQFQRPGVPTGVVLAGLRVVMERPTPPATLAAALAHPAFQGAVAQARLLVSQNLAHQDAWSRFLWHYRTVQSTTLRQVNPDEHHALQQLFQQQPEACTAVLERIAQMATPPPRLTPRYLAQAVKNNLQAALERDLQTPSRPPCAPRAVGVHVDTTPPIADTGALSADAVTQLTALGLRPGDLQPFEPMLVQAWLAAYQERRTQISHPRNWLLWGLRSGVRPEMHPDLQRHPAHTTPAAPPITSLPNAAVQKPSADPLWSRVLEYLRPQFPASEFTTWLAPTALVELVGDTAVVAVEHIFARETLQAHYHAALMTAVQAVVGQPVEVEIVIDATAAAQSVQRRFSPV